MPAQRLARPVRATLLVIVLALLLVPAHLRPASAATDGKLVLVLDSSGSMQDRTEGPVGIGVGALVLGAGGTAAALAVCRRRRG